MKHGVKSFNDLVEYLLKKYRKELLDSISDELRAVITRYIEDTVFWRIVGECVGSRLDEEVMYSDLGKECIDKS